MKIQEIRPQAVQIAEQAAWKQIQNLQRIAFEKGGLLGVMDLNELLIKNYRILFHEGDGEGRSALLARGMTASTFLTDLLPQIEQEMAGNEIVSLLMCSKSEDSANLADLAA